MSDPTAKDRLKRRAELNWAPSEREKLQQVHGPVWNTSQFQRDFEVLGFLAPYVMVRRKEDGRLGSVEFQASPRYYFNFEED